MRNFFKAKKILAVCWLAMPGVSTAQLQAAFGPVEYVMEERSDITVSGQTFSITPATRFAIKGKSVSLSNIRQSLTVDSYAYVEGQLVNGVPVASKVQLTGERYVPGASLIHVVGQVNAISAASGVIRIGQLSVNSSSFSPTDSAALRLGSYVMVSGIQPAPRGALVGAVRLSIGGTGSQVQSIGGTASPIRNTSGAVLQVQSIGGIGKLSIGGTGSQVQSIGGTGRSIRNTSGAALQVQSIGGTGKLSIGGTGSQFQSIGGTGAQFQSIGGTGRQFQSIGGTGRQLQSIGGTGRQLQSIGGTGVQLQSIGGTGHQLQSIGGTGRGLQGIGGTGRQLSSIGGTGQLH